MFSVGNSNPFSGPKPNLNNNQSFSVAQFSQATASQSIATVDPALQDKLDFTNLLVASIIGLGLNDIKLEKRPEIIEKCWDIYTNYVYGYVEQKYGKQEALRIKGQASFDTDLSIKFPQIPQYLSEATSAFLETLEEGINTTTAV